MPDQHILAKPGWKYYRSSKKGQVHFVDGADCDRCPVKKECKRRLG